MRGRPNTAADFWAKVQERGGCWEYPRNQNGYGLFSFKRRTLPAHRFAYEDMVAEIPDGLVLDHLCRNRSCVRPDHLDPVPHAENVRRGVGPTAQNHKKTHCVNGHEFTPDNTYPKAGGGRNCVVCAKRRAREHKRRNR